MGGERIELIVGTPEDAPNAARALSELAAGDVQVEEHGRRLTAHVAGGPRALRDALDRLDDAGVAILDVGLRRPTLDDVFLTLTGSKTGVVHQRAPCQGPRADLHLSAVPASR